MPWFDIFENSGSRIVAVALMSIPANGNSRYPLLNAAKSFTPKYLLMKNWLAELIIKPYKLAVDIGFINLNILFIGICDFLGLTPLNGMVINISPVRQVIIADMTKPIMALDAVAFISITGSMVHTIINVRLMATYIITILDIPYTVRILSTPITGISNMGVIEKYMRL